MKTCWTPEKIRFENWLQAEDFIKLKSLNAEPYSDCPCGFVHIRNKTKKNRRKKRNRDRNRIIRKLNL